VCDNKVCNFSTASCLVNGCVDGFVCAAGVCLPDILQPCFNVCHTGNCNLNNSIFLFKPDGLQKITDAPGGKVIRFTSAGENNFGLYYQDGLQVFKNNKWSVAVGDGGDGTCTFGQTTRCNLYGGLSEDNEVFFLQPDKLILSGTPVPTSTALIYANGVGAQVSAKDKTFAIVDQNGVLFIQRIPGGTTLPIPTDLPPGFNISNSPSTLAVKILNNQTIAVIRAFTDGKSVNAMIQIFTQDTVAVVMSFYQSFDGTLNEISCDINQVNGVLYTAMLISSPLTGRKNLYYNEYTSGVFKMEKVFGDFDISTVCCMSGKLLFLCSSKNCV
jgi:hypothetical protein